MKQQNEKIFRTLTKKEVRELKGGYIVIPDAPGNETKSIIEQIIEEMRGGWICR